MTDPLDVIREQLLSGIHRRRRARRRVLVAVAAVSVVALGVGAVSALLGGGDGEGSVVVTGTATSTTAVSHSVNPRPAAANVRGAAIWAIEQPPTWDRAGSELMPNLGWASLTLATVPLRAGGERCAHLPERALRDLGDDDALVSVFFAGEAHPEDSPWPAAGFDGGELPRGRTHGALECSERSDLAVHWGRRQHGGQALWLLVVFGPEASEGVRADAWRTLSSLEAPATPSGAPVCVLTKPWPLTDVPGGDPEFHPPQGLSWHGTPALWTALPTDGPQGWRKSVWWSVAFPGGREEPAPDIAVTWRRLDATRPVVRSSAPGTNAWTPETGDFMIAGVDPVAPGCWEVSASYGGRTLDYVYWNPPQLWTTTDSASAGGDDDNDDESPIEGRLVFDEDANCFTLHQPEGPVPVVWPAGSTVSPDASIISLPDGEAVRVGDQVAVAGHYATPSSTDIARIGDCPSARSEIAILTGGASE